MFIVSCVFVALSTNPSNDVLARAALAQAIAPALSPRYAELRTRSIAENRPLLVWVGLSRPDIEASRPDALHLHCERFPDATSPCVILARPRGAALWRVRDVPAHEVNSLLPIRICGPSGCQYLSAPNF